MDSEAGVGRSPLAVWRVERGMTVEQLAKVIGVEANQIKAIEAGEDGLIGEVQYYLAQQGENVSNFASRQSAFIALHRGE